MNGNKQPHVVIVGGGFGGLKAATQLRNAPCRVTLVDRRNHHLFQPLLYQVATGGLSPANIAVPLRRILRKQKNCETIMAEVTGFDLPANKIHLADGELAFDYLILAAGAVSSYFGKDEWAQNAPGLKSLDDAREVRMKIFGAFEAAEREPDPEQRRKWLNFVVVGGGPTGVELAGAISEIARMTLVEDFRHINPADARILLVEAGPDVLGPFPEDLRQKARAALEAKGIEVMTSTKVTGVEQQQVHLETKDGPISIPTWTVIWGAGVKANPLAALLAEATGATPDRGGRIPVTTGLNIAGQDHIFALGDLAICPDGEGGKPLPGLGSVAMQQGAYLGKKIARELAGEKVAGGFKYSDKGTMATIGRSAAVADIGGLHLSGFIAWLMWMGVHLMLLIQFQSRLLVFMQWAWNYFTNSRSSRLILGVKKIALPGRERPPSDQPRT